MTTSHPTEKPACALKDDSRQSRRVRGETRQEATPGHGDRTAGVADRSSRIPQVAASATEQAPGTHRDAVNQLMRLYCELGTATFDCVDGRLLSHEYQARRAALCAEIRRQLIGLSQGKGATTR